MGRGGSDHGSASTFATVFAGKGTLPGFRVLSRNSPSTRRSAAAKRRWHITRLKLSYPME
jgi:hypothetical protein